MDFISSLKSNPEITGLVTLVGVAYASDRIYNVRYIKKIVPISTSGFILYRLFSDDTSRISILESILKLLKNKRAKLVTGDILGLIAITGAIYTTKQLLNLKWFGNDSDITASLYDLIKYLPFVSDQIDIEKKKLREGIDRDIKSKARAVGSSLNTIELPPKGLTESILIKLLTNTSGEEGSTWEAGKVSGAVYHGGKGHMELLNKAFGMYSLANPLHADVFPSLIKFESEIVAMTANILRGDKNVQGCTTSGGTESIILAIKAHRDYYRDEKGITSPELICCTTAHAAVDKACDILNIKLLKLPPNQISFTLESSLVESTIGTNTIMIYASAPSFAQGTVDPIEDLSKLAIRYNIGLHVDCCLGGFVLPFMKDLGYNVPAFDFSLPGVTSISADTHKYGYSLKGSSVLLYGSSSMAQQIRRAMYFCYPSWSGGIYTTPTIAGSRCGGLIAQCWVSLVATGKSGYMEAVAGIIKTTRNIASSVSSIDGLEVIGGAEYMIVCFRSKNPKEFNIYNVHDYMTKKGWSLNSLQDPACLHLCVTRCHFGIEEDFQFDLQNAVQFAKEMKKSGQAGGSAAIYGMTGSLPPGPVKELLREYNDCLLDCKQE